MVSLEGLNGYFLAGGICGGLGITCAIYSIYPPRQFVDRKQELIRGSIVCSTLGLLLALESTVGILSLVKEVAVRNLLSPTNAAVFFSGSILLHNYPELRTQAMVSFLLGSAIAVTQLAFFTLTNTISSGA